MILKLAHFFYISPKRSKILQKNIKLINIDLKNHVALDGSEISHSKVRLRAYVSKNKASFFAKASAGICISGNTELFKREDHFHINLVDDINQECVGNLMAYDMNHNGKRVLLIGGFNPNTALLKDIDIKSYCSSIIEVAKTFARDNQFNAVYMTDQATYGSISNRHEIADYLLKQYGKTSEDADFQLLNNRDETRLKRIFPIEIF